MKKTQFTRWLCVTLLILQCAASGCHRSYYRRQADNEAQQLVAEKATDPRWDWADGSVAIDPQSRMFDPFSADHPPIPPDDAASHQFMHCVDEKAGYPYWHANGDTDFVENPEWRSYLPMNEDGQVVLDFDSAFELAKLHSTQFQAQRETLYVSALDVSLERFGFDTQLFAGFNSFFTRRGNSAGPTLDDSGNVIGDQRSQLDFGLGSTGGGITLRRLGITGATFAAGLANTILWNFSGADTQTVSRNLLDFSIIQPLLQDAGRERIMEALTQAERTLLANVRQMDRYRRGFYLQVIIGRNPGAGPNLAGNFINSPGSPNTGAGGFLGLLQQKQSIRIQEFNIRQLKNVLEQFKELYDRERLNALQVFQFENTVYTAQNNLLSARIRYQNSLDAFKRQLGLPPYLEVFVDDSYLDNFEFLSDNINQRQIDLYGLKTVTGESVIASTELIDAENGVVDPAVIPSLTTIRDNVVKAIAMIDEVLNVDVAEIEADIEKLRIVRPRRLEYFRYLRENISKYELLSDVDPSLFGDDSIVTPEELTEDLGKTIANLTRVKQSLNTMLARLDDTPNQREAMNDVEFAEYLSAIMEQVPESLSIFSSVLVEFSVLQARARSDAIELTDVDLNDEQAFAIARCFRRDWMNARANLVDSWRQIEFVANQLESQVDLVFEGSVGNSGDNPFRIRLANGELRGGFRFDAPIVRLVERNRYREILINYQQTKRAFYEFRDEIHLGLRQTLRELSLNKALFEVNRRSVQVAIQQLDSAQLELNRPVRPGGSSQLGATTSRDLTQAIDALQNSQLRFLGTWVSYEVARHNLDFDMGTMQVDSLGRWIDPGEIDASIAGRAATMLGITLDCQFCDEAAMVGAEGSVVGPMGEMDPGGEMLMELPGELDGDAPSEQGLPDSEIAPELPNDSVPVPRPPQIEPPALPSDTQGAEAGPGTIAPAEFTRPASEVSWKVGDHADREMISREVPEQVSPATVSSVPAGKTEAERVDAEPSKWEQRRSIDRAGMSAEGSDIPLEEAAQRTAQVGTPFASIGPAFGIPTWNVETTPTQAGWFSAVDSGLTADFSDRAPGEGEPFQLRPISGDLASISWNLPCREENGPSAVGNGADAAENAFRAVNLLKPLIVTNVEATVPELPPAAPTGPGEPNESAEITGLAPALTARGTVGATAPANPLR